MKQFVPNVDLKSVVLDVKFYCTHDETVFLVDNDRLHCGCPHNGICIAWRKHGDEKGGHAVCPYLVMQSQLGID